MKPTPSPELTIIVVNYNTADFLKTSFRALFFLTKMPFQVVVCDNGSTPDDLERLKYDLSFHTNVELIIRQQTQAGSMGHGEALNLMMKKANTPYTAVLDADCLPLMKDWDQFLVDQLNDKVKIAGTPVPVVHENYKPTDFPLMYLCLFETQTFKDLEIDFRPRDLSKHEDTGWELREKYRAAGYEGFCLYGENTRQHPRGHFANTICDQYYTNSEDLTLFCSHLGRGSAPKSRKYRKFAKTRLGERKAYFKDRNNWLSICETVIDEAVIQMAKQQERGMTYVTCPVCGSDHPQKLFTTTDHQSMSAGYWNVVRCQNCQTAYTNPRPANEDWDLPSHEASKTIEPSWLQQALETCQSHCERKAASSRLWKAATLPMKFQFGRPVIPTPPQSIPLPRLLHVGRVDSNHLQKYQKLGWYVEALNVQTQSMGDIDYPEDHFDFIIMEQVLEHFANPHQALQKCQSWLKPGGQLQIQMLDFDGVETQWFQEYAKNVQAPKHLSHFNEQSLSQLLEGFDWNTTHQYDQHDLKSGLELYLKGHPTSSWRHALKIPKPLLTLGAFTFAVAGKSSRMSIQATKK